MTRLTLVVPVYNEEAMLEAFVNQIRESLRDLTDIQWEILFVDDGSGDNTPHCLKDLARREERLHYLRLTRNFGKEAAIQAGLSHANGDVVIVLDADLQHPPELIPQMLDHWHRGAEVVEAVKRSRGREGWLRTHLTRIFYRLFTTWSGLDIARATDFKLLDRRVVQAYLALPESSRFFRGLMSWMGFSCVAIFFDVPERPAATSRWSLLSLFSYSIRNLTAFSNVPLHLITWLGLLTFGVSLVFGGIGLYHKLAGVALDGFTTVILLLLFSASASMLSIGILGVYVARIYEEVKRRPVYLIDQRRSHIETP